MGEDGILCCIFFDIRDMPYDLDAFCEKSGRYIYRLDAILEEDGPITQISKDSWHMSFSVPPNRVFY
jgi:hypothetical protein